MARVVIFLVLAGFGLLAQNPSDPTETKTPASREDVEKATNEATKKVMKALGEVEKKALQRSKQEQEKREKESAAEALKIQSEIMAHTAAAKKESEKTRTEALSVILASFLFLSVAILLIWLKKPQMKHVFTETSVPVENRTRIALVANEPHTEVLVDPDILALTTFSARNNGIRQVPFLLVLKEGKLNCTAHLRPGMAPLVHFEGNDPSVKSAWDKRRQSGATLLLAKQKTFAS